jgi:hypothetical protein
VTQSLAFRRPVLVGESVTAEVEVVRMSGSRATFATRVWRLKGEDGGGAGAAGAAAAAAETGPGATGAGAGSAGAAAAGAAGAGATATAGTGARLEGAGMGAGAGGGGGELALDGTAVALLPRRAGGCGHLGR